VLLLLTYLLAILKPIKGQQLCVALLAMEVGCCCRARRRHGNGGRPIQHRWSAFCQTREFCNRLRKSASSFASAHGQQLHNAEVFSLLLELVLLTTF